MPPQELEQVPALEPVLVQPELEQVAAAFPQRIVAIDGSRPRDELAEEILEGVREHS